MEGDGDDSSAKRLICPVCLDIFSTPRALPCLHTYCERCLKIILGKAGAGHLCCPECRRVHNIENDDVTTLQKNFLMVDLIDEHHKKMKRRKSQPKPARSRSPEEEEDLPPPMSLSSPSTPSAQTPTAPECRDHGRAVVQYCRACDKVLCEACLPACTHPQERQELGRAAEERRKALADLVDRAHDHGKRISSGLPSKAELESTIAACKESLLCDVDAAFDAILAQVASRRDYFTQAVEQGMREQRTLLFEEARVGHARVEKIDRHTNTISACLGSAGVGGGAGAVQLLGLSRNVLQEVEAFLKTSPLRASQHSSLEAVKFTVSREQVARLQDQIGCVGHLSMGVHAPHCHVQGLPASQQLAAGSHHQLQLVCLNASQQPCQEVDSVRPQVSVRLVSRAPEMYVEGTVLKASGNVLFLTLTAPHHHPGNYQFHTTISGQHVGNSPLDLIVLSSPPAPPPAQPEPAVALPTYCSEISDRTERTRMSDVAVTKSGMVVATDLQGDRVLVYTSSGKLEYEFGSRGRQEGQFNEPRSIAVDEEENIFVADYNNHRVQKFNGRNKGRYMLCLSAPKQGGTMDCPSGVSVAADNTVFVSEQFSCRILVYTSAGAHVRSFSLPKGEGPKQMKFASSITVGPKKTLYVADKQLSTIHVVSSDGVYQRRLIDDGKVPNKLRKPFGITVDTNTGSIFVAEADSHCITMVTKAGSVHHFGKRGKGKDGFHNPQGLFYHSQRNLLFVVDQQNKRIVVYKCV